MSKRKVNYFEEARLVITTSIPKMPFIEDERFLKMLYRIKMGRKLDLESPKLYTEKIQWLKLYDHNPFYHKLVDKHEVKKYVDEILGEGYTIPELGVWDSFDDIDFDKLPDRFVLKCTHDSGGQVFCRGKETFNFTKARKKLNKCLKVNYYSKGREWAYKDVPRRIIAEPIIEELGKPDSVEYKLICMNGKVVTITVCGGIAHALFADRQNDTFDRNYNHVEGIAYYKNAPQQPTLPKEIDEIVECAEKLSKGIPQVRVDFYLINGKVLFGEMTFYTWSGIMQFEPKDCDRMLGELLVLPEKRFEE